MNKICEKHQEHKILHGSRFKCKSCNKEYQRKWYSENRDKQSQRVRPNNQKYIERNARYVFDYLLTHHCVVCRENDPVVLQFDHRDPSNKTAGIAVLISKGAKVATLQEEIDKCDVLCANCHARKTAKDNNWRKYIWLQES